MNFFHACIPWMEQMQVTAAAGAPLNDFVFKFPENESFSCQKNKTKHLVLPHGVGHSSTCKEGELALSHLYSSIISNCY